MKKVLLWILTILGWITLAIKMYLRIDFTDSTSFIASTVQFFCYFTIVTNLLATLYCTIQLIRPKTLQASFFRSPKTLTALTVYILIVGVVFNLVLKSLLKAKGLDAVLSEIHHTLVPIGIVLLWGLTENKKQLTYIGLLSWLWYPMIYISFVLIHGSFTHFYPYPFLNVITLGLEKVLMYSVFMFFVMALLLVLFNFLAKKIVLPVASSK